MASRAHVQTGQIKTAFLVRIICPEPDLLGWLVKYEELFWGDQAGGREGLWPFSTLTLILWMILPFFCYSRFAIFSPLAEKTCWLGAPRWDPAHPGTWHRQDENRRSRSHLGGGSGLVLTTSSVNMMSSSWGGGRGRGGSRDTTLLMLSWQWVISGWSFPWKQQENRPDRPRPRCCFSRVTMATQHCCQNTEEEYFYSMVCVVLRLCPEIQFNYLP